MTYSPSPIMLGLWKSIDFLKAVIFTYFIWMAQSSLSFSSVCVLTLVYIWFFSFSPFLSCDERHVLPPAWPFFFFFSHATTLPWPEKGFIMSLLMRTFTITAKIKTMVMSGRGSKSAVLAGRPAVFSSIASRKWIAWLFLSRYTG